MAEGVVATRLVHTRAEKGRIIRSAFVSTMAVVEKNEEGQMWATSEHHEMVMRDDDDPNIPEWDTSPKELPEIFPLQRENCQERMTSTLQQLMTQRAMKLLRKAPVIES